MKSTIKENVSKAITRYIGIDACQNKNPLNILNIYDDIKLDFIESIFEDCDAAVEYITKDGKIPSDKKDIVICYDYFGDNWSVSDGFGDIAQTINPKGYLILVSSNSDTRNFNLTKTGIRNLSEAYDLQVVDCWQETKGKEQELVFVIRNKGNASGWDGKPQDDIRGSTIIAPTHISQKIEPGSDDEEKTSGLINYLDFFATLHHKLNPQSYMEIGVRHGKSLAQAKCPAIGIDPAPEITHELFDATILEYASDDFFESQEKDILPSEFDFVFIDGMHLFEYALRDYMNCEHYTHENTIVIFDDIFPSHTKQALRERDTQVWTGDVWKIIPCFKHYRPDLALIGIDTAPTGLLLILNTNNQNSALAYNYNDILSEYIIEKDAEPPSSITSREGVIRHDNPLLLELLDLIANKKINSSDAIDIINKIKL